MSAPSGPVFAVLSGISTRDWRPVHDFCERHEVPCLLPNTPLPAVTSGPGRRYLVNRAYLLTIGEGASPSIRSALWIVP